MYSTHLPVCLVPPGDFSETSIFCFYNCYLYKGTTIHKNCIPLIWQYASNQTQLGLRAIPFEILKGGGGLENHICSQVTSNLLKQHYFTNFHHCHRQSKVAFFYAVKSAGTGGGFHWRPQPHGMRQYYQKIPLDQDAICISRWELFTGNIYIFQSPFNSSS